MGTLAMGNGNKKKFPDFLDYTPCPMPDAPCPMPHARYPMPDAPCPMPHARCPMPDAPCPMPDARCPMPDAPCPMPHSYPNPCCTSCATRLSRCSCSCMSFFVQGSAKVLNPQLIIGLGISNSKRLTKRVPFSTG